MKSSLGLETKMNWANECSRYYVCYYGDDEYNFIFAFNNDGSFSGNVVPPFNPNKDPNHPFSAKVFPSYEEAYKAGMQTKRSFFIVAALPGMNYEILQTKI